MTAIHFNMSKLLEMFKGLKSDAMPRAPRPTEAVNSETSQPEGHTIYVDPADEEHEEIIIEPVSDDEIKKEKKSKKKFFKSKKVVDDDEDIKPAKDKRDSNSSVNVQATGNVYNIVNASGVRLGNDYYFGPVTMGNQTKTGTGEKEKKYKDDEDIKMDNLIRLLMEAKIKPDHDYIDYVSKNLGKNWHCFFRSLGFTQGRIETAEINAAGYDISEARYKLLLDWVNNDEDGTLGRLASSLWEEGDRSIVKQLSTMYKKSKK